jgi:2-phosphoglycerate kinase
VLFKSSYEIDRRSVDDTSQNVLTNYVAQAAIVVSEIGSQYLGSGNRCVIVEGVHLNSSVLSMLGSKDYIILFLRMPGIQEHRRRLRQRNLLGRAMSDKHCSYFNNIRDIGTFLDNNWSLEAQNNRRVFLIDAWQEVDAILGRFIDHGI